MFRFLSVWVGLIFFTSLSLAADLNQALITNNKQAVLGSMDVAKDVAQIQELAADVVSSHGSLVASETASDYLLSKEDLQPLLEEGKTIDITINGKEYTLLSRERLNFYGSIFSGFVAAMALGAWQTYSYIQRLKTALSAEKARNAQQTERSRVLTVGR